MPKSLTERWSKARAHAMGKAIEHIFFNAEGRALQDGQAFNDAEEVGFAAGCECIASQLNVLVHYYGQARFKAEPDTYGGSSHYDFMAELLEDIGRRALTRHLTPGERSLG
jgi:hypothetical protein